MQNLFCASHTQKATECIMHVKTQEARSSRLKFREPDNEQKISFVFSQRVKLNTKKPETILYAKKITISFTVAWKLKWEKVYHESL